MCLLKIQRVVRDKTDQSRYLCRIPVHVDDDMQISALDVLFYQMDGRKSRYNKEVLDWYGEDDAGDLRRHTLKEAVENMTTPNAFECKVRKVRKVTRTA